MKLLYAIGLGFLLTVFASCEYELYLFSQEVEQAVVYGMICPADSIHYIRIEKTFQTNNTDEMNVREEDIHIDSASIQLEGIVEGEIVWRKFFERVSAQKDSGFFPGTNHYLYKCTGLLYGIYQRSSLGRGVDMIRLNIAIPDLHISATATTRSLGPTTIYLNRYGSKMISCYGDQISKLKLSYPIEGNSNLVGSNYVELGMKFYYSEYGQDWSNHDSIISITPDADFTEGYYVLNPERIFNRILQGIDTNHEVRTRVLDSIHFFSIVPDGPFGEFWETRINRSDRDLPPYSNFDQQEVFGMFCSITKAYETGFYLDQRSLDSLSYGQKWKHLKFKHW